MRILSEEQLQYVSGGQDLILVDNCGQPIIEDLYSDTTTTTTTTTDTTTGGDTGYWSSGPTECI